MLTLLGQVFAFNEPEADVEQLLIELICTERGVDHAAARAPAVCSYGACVYRLDEGPRVPGVDLAVMGDMDVVGGELGDPGISGPLGPFAAEVVLITGAPTKTAARVNAETLVRGWATPMLCTV